MVLRYQIRTCGKTRETTPQPKRESHVAEIPSHKEMHSATLLAAAVAGLAGSAAAVTVHGALVFTRHGDRTTKWYKAQALTSLGAEQNYQVGGSYRQRYLSSSSPDAIRGISQDKYVSSQVFASAPDQGILMNTATAFLQGLYPPLEDVAPDVASQGLNNGTNSTSPLGGYQYVVLHGISDNSPDAIWIKGDDECPAYTASSKGFSRSDEFRARDDATRGFYARFYDVLAPGVYNLKREDVSYARAFDVFDLVNVARIHNATSPARNVSDEDLAQLRTLADSAELGLNWNASEPMRAVGAKTLSGVVLRQLNATVSSRGATPKLSLLAGSYDTFLAFFGLTGLLDTGADFHGLPEYASSMAFELFTDGNDDKSFPADPAANLRVRWLFRNGTAGTLKGFPLFGTGEASLPWPRFVSEMQKRAITDVGDWCDKCASKAGFCAAYRDDDGEAGGAEKNSGGGGGDGGISKAVAGVIGAMVTLAVVAVVGGLAWMVLRRKRKGAGRQQGDKTSVRSGSTDERTDKV
ncbi:histidine acid phosphatase [Purpureocillium lilacinum]|uniref:Histidine acid phosphatase n=1 Tax=Purpureocillium lilacinum TaxID=33203 RepID=A0A179GFI7_PURLI|nr:histidine acid phosphatase [Purpureocillium lilacinum]